MNNMEYIYSCIHKLSHFFSQAHHAHMTNIVPEDSEHVNEQIALDSFLTKFYIVFSGKLKLIIILIIITVLFWVRNPSMLKNIHI